ENIEAKLLEARTVLVEGPVNDKMYHAVVARLLFLEAKDPKANILVVVNSPGGSADSGFGVYDVMKFLACPITTLTAGLCASAGVLVHLGGQKGRRFVTPNSRFLLHQPSTQMYGQASDMEISAKEILRMRKRFAAIVAREIGATQEKVEADSNRDFWLNSEESMKYGLVDKVISSRAEIG
ncbi:MAG: ATP-dependent Clp protease proteolytic subunit, partial [Planctomycetota bacterium]